MGNETTRRVIMPSTFTAQEVIDKLTGDEKRAISDGYHTFEELYEFRMLYNAALFNEWAAQGKYKVHKSVRHHDGEKCFGGGWFIVVAELPTGMISNHYKLENWAFFDVPEVDKSFIPFDGHTPRDVVERLTLFLQGSNF